MLHNRCRKNLLIIAYWKHVTFKMRDDRDVRNEPNHRANSSVKLFARLIRRVRFTRSTISRYRDICETQQLPCVTHDGNSKKYIFLHNLFCPARINIKLYYTLERDQRKRSTLHNIWFSNEISELNSTLAHFEFRRHLLISNIENHAHTAVIFLRFEIGVRLISTCTSVFHFSARHYMF